MWLKLQVACQYVGSTCRLGASRTLNLLPCISLHGIMVNSALKQSALFAITNLTFYKQCFDLALILYYSMFILRSRAPSFLGFLFL